MRQKTSYIYISQWRVCGGFHVRAILPIKFSIYQLTSSSHHHVPSNFPSITPSSSSHHHVSLNFPSTNSHHHHIITNHHFFHPSAHFVHPSINPPIKSSPSIHPTITSLFGQYFGTHMNPPTSPLIEFLFLFFHLATCEARISETIINFILNEDEVRHCPMEG